LLKLRTDHFEILGNSNTVQQGIDIVTENIVWMELHQDEIGNWLADPSATEPSPSTEATTPTTTPTTTTPTTTRTTTPTSTTQSTSSTTSTTQATTTPSAASGIGKMNAALILVVMLLGKFIVHSTNV
jgi:hypothetical protein